MRLPIPTNLKQLQSFLGLAGYFRKFIADFAIIANPLSDLTKKHDKFEIKEKQLNAFESLKNALSKNPVLNIFNHQ